LGSLDEIKLPEEGVLLARDALVMADEFVDEPLKPLLPDKALYVSIVIHDIDRNFTLESIINRQQ